MALCWMNKHIDASWVAGVTLGAGQWLQECQENWKAWEIEACLHGYWPREKRGFKALFGVDR